MCEGDDADRPGEGLPLPADIAFLAGHGIAPAELTEIARRADRLGVEASRQCLAEELVSEDSFYRAVARELGLPFIETPPRLLAGGDHRALLREGIAAVVGGAHPQLRTLLAPEGRALRRLLAIGKMNRADIAVTTPRRLATALREANAQPLSRHIAGLDEAGTGRASARNGSVPGQRLALGTGVLASGFFGTLAPLETFFTLALLAIPIFLCLILLRIAAALEAPDRGLARHDRWRIDDSRLPVYTVAIPMVGEETVLPQMLAALAALDYPKSKLDIRFLIEAHDRGMRDAFARLALPPHISVLIVPRGEPRTKPRALNLALLEARGELLTIYDAEDIPDPGQLRLAAARFLRAPRELACLQARLVIDHASEGPVAAFFALEYAGLFGVLNPGLLRFQLPIMLGGTSNHFRTEVLRELGGWDAWNVTEDADLGLRLVRAGYRIGDLPSETREEAPVSLPAWIRQRSRWIKGYIQTVVTHTAAPLALVREAGIPATACYLALSLGTVVSALVYPVFAYAAFLAWQDGSLLSPQGTLTSVSATLAVTVWLFGFMAMIAPPAIGAWRRRTVWMWLLLPFLPLYFALVTIAAWLAVYEYVNDRYGWNKTRHGVARKRPLTDVSATPPRPLPAAVRY